MAYSTGETLARAAANAQHLNVATVTALSLLPKEECVDGMRCVVTADNSSWVFSIASTAVDTTLQLAVQPSGAAFPGCWLRADRFVDLKLAISFATADAALLFTVPAGFRIRPTRPLWEVTAPFAGGTASTIGLSSNNSAYNTKGDLLGGAAGDAAAVLVSTTPGPFVGAAGTKITGAVVLVATNTILFNQIASAFTSGAGFAHVPVELMAL